MTRGPASHVIQLAHWSQSAKKANRRARSVLPTRGRCAASSSPRPTAQPPAWGPRPTCHTPGVPIPEYEEGEPPREERASAYGSVPLRLRQNQQPSPWHKGPGPRVTLLGRWFLGAEKSHRRSRQYRASSGPPQKTEKMNFQNQCSGIEAPRAWPSGTIKYGSHGSVSRGDRRDSWREQAVITTASTRKQRANHQSNFGPTCRLVPSPEAGPGATVGTLNQGYPLLQYEGMVPVRQSLAAQ
jgi:hypothetical protein